MRAGEVFGCVQEPLHQVERQLLAQAEEIVEAWFHDGAYGDYVRQAVGHLLHNPGKLLRPALVLLSAGLVDPRSPRWMSGILVPLATTVELIHTASLVHDDIIDEEAMRRDRPSVPASFGNRAAVLVGDILYTQAFSLLTRLELPRWDQQRELFRLFCDASRAMCLGELVEQRMLGQNSAGPASLDREGYLEVLRNKTAVLMSACCQSAGVACGASADVLAELSSFGMSFGLAFQLFDDLKDEDALAGPQIDIPAEAGRCLARAMGILEGFPDSPYRRELLRACSLIAGAVPHGGSGGPAETGRLLDLLKGGRFGST